MNLKYMLVVSMALALFACSKSSTSSLEPETASSSDGGLAVPSSSSTATTVTVALPSGANTLYPDALYSIWKAKWYETLADERTHGVVSFSTTYFTSLPSARIRWDSGTSICAISGLSYSAPAVWNNYKTGCSVSEGIGYGMLITLFQNDMNAFDSLWNYNKGARNANYYETPALMPWMVRGFDDVASSAAYAAALDADFDVATSLIIAYYKYASTDPTRANAYLADALNVGKAILTYGINSANNLIYPGDSPMWTSATGSGYNIYNLSYFSPVGLRLLASVDATNAARWNAILAAGYAYMHQVQANGAGLFPDWSNASFVAADPNSSSKNTYKLFDKEAIRISWRIAWDYYWFQSVDAAQVLNTMANFMIGKTGGDVNAISATTYAFADGAVSTSVGSGANFTGSYCLMGFAGATDWFNNCAVKFNGLTIANAAYTSYYSDILQLLFSQLMNGKFVRPF